MGKRFSEIIFFILLALVYIIFFLATNYFYVDKTSFFKKVPLLVISSVIFSLFFFGYTQLTNLFNNENFKHYSSSSAKLCKGGPYMWQGNSNRAKFCRNLYSTPQGKYEIDRIDCGSGFTGMRGHDFEFTPVSDGCWCNKRCDKFTRFDNNDKDVKLNLSGNLRQNNSNQFSKDDKHMS